MAYVYQAIHVLQQISVIVKQVFPLPLPFPRRLHLQLMMMIKPFGKSLLELFSLVCWLWACLGFVYFVLERHVTDTIRGRGGKDSN